MSRERLPRADARGPRARPDVALQPPPRPGDAGAVPPGTPSSPRASRPGAAVALLAVLAVAMAGVFLLLPRWMARRPPSAAALPQPSVPAASSDSPEARPGAVEAPAAEEPMTEPPAVDPSAEDPPADDPPIADTRRPARRPQAALSADPPAPAAGDPGTAEWSRAMSEGLAALDSGRFAEAQAALARAEAARPGTRAAADAIKRAEEGLKGEAMSRHRARGESAEAREDWRAALVEYDAALKLEPQVAFAQEGRARSRPRAELDETLAAYLQRPERLSTEAVAREAERALVRAREASPDGPRLQQQTAALERLLREARTPVDVHLVSDGLTEVSVLRVGSLGTFREKKVALRPGSYVVVGKRQGYRDSRQTLVVSPTRVPPPLDVRCQEAL